MKNTNQRILAQSEGNTMDNQIPSAPATAKSSSPSGHAPLGAVIYEAVSRLVTTTTRLVGILGLFAVATSMIVIAGVALTMMWWSSFFASSVTPEEVAGNLFGLVALAMEATAAYTLSTEIVTIIMWLAGAWVFLELCIAGISISVAIARDANHAPIKQ
ncbi:MAG: hypothetical protein ACYDA1_04325 [Vulcanimicrobiaceae bacterium]